MKQQSGSHLPHTLLFVFLFHWINKPRIELGLRRILRLHTHPTDAATPVCETQVTKQTRKRNHASCINACVVLGYQNVRRGRRAILSPLGKGASAPNSNFAGLNSTQKQHTSCSLYPSQCPPWRTWIYGWRKQTDMLASNLYVERVDPLGTVVKIRTPPAWTSKDSTLCSDYTSWFSHETVLISVTTLTDWAVSWRLSLSCMRQQLV
jgi:hypothetical protein